MVAFQNNWQKDWSGTDSALPVVEMVELERVKFRKTKLSEDNVLPVDSSLELKILLTDLVDGILETFVLGHVIKVVEDIEEMVPILHHYHAGSVHVHHLD